MRDLRKDFTVQLKMMLKSRRHLARQLLAYTVGKRMPKVARQRLYKNLSYYSCVFTCKEH